MMLVLTRCLDEEIVLSLGDEWIILKVVKIDRGQIRLGFTASRRVSINRVKPEEEPDVATR